MPTSASLLHQLARAYGIQTAYYDVSHRRQPADSETLLVMLQALGAPVANLNDTPFAWRERQQAMWRQIVEPIYTAWDGELSPISLRLPAHLDGSSFAASLLLENGEQKRYEWRGTDLLSVETVGVEGTKYVTGQLSLPGRLPPGYHRLIMDIAGKLIESLIIAAPVKAYDTPEDDCRWGVFLPLYALYTQRSLGGGDFSDLEALSEWAVGKGAGVLATLPLLPTFADKGTDPSPYTPVSRLLWNESYISLDKIPEFHDCPSAQTIFHSATFHEEAEALRKAPLVDYLRQAALKRQVLETLCKYFFANTPASMEELRHFADSNPVAADYALFRAAGEKYGISWRAWPQRLREGEVRDSDYDEAIRRYHLFVQWLAHRQMQELSQKARDRDIQLYLDLPQGVHADGYDVWRYRDAFIGEAAAGAPPDTVFTRGQNWTFPPLHPHKIREQGYKYTIACLQHHLQHAGILRIDHMMGFHRLFCIPNGMEASRGVYLRYPADELYAILTLESHRHHSIIVGEDLGTVPPYVRPAMKRHGLNRMYVLHYELASCPEKGPPPITRNLVASLNTHDMPPFASFWAGSDIEERLKLGLLDKASAAKERQTLQIIRKALSSFLYRNGWLANLTEETSAILKACLSFLSASTARILLVNLEDLWEETRPQNVPGVSANDYPSWRRRVRYGFEAFSRMPAVNNILREINNLRSGNNHAKVIR